MLYYHIQTTAPCRLQIKGKLVSYGANERVIVEKYIGDTLLRGANRNKLQFVREVEDSHGEEDRPASQRQQSVRAFAEESQDGAAAQTRLRQDPEVRSQSGDLESEEPLPQVPLPEDEHWTRVRKYLWDLEEQPETDYRMVQAIYQQFGHHKPIRKECNRILGVADEEKGEDDA